MLHVYVIVARELADSHPEDVQVAEDAASGTHELVAVSVTISGDPDGLEEGVDSASERTGVDSVRPIVRGGTWEGRREILKGVETPGAADCAKAAPKVPPRNAASAIRVEHAAAVHAGKHRARNSPGMDPATLLLGDGELPYGDARVGAAAHE